MTKINVDLKTRTSPMTPARALAAVAALASRATGHVGTKELARLGLMAHEQTLLIR